MDRWSFEIGAVEYVRPEVGLIVTISPLEADLIRLEKEGQYPGAGPY